MPNAAARAAIAKVVADRYGLATRGVRVALRAAHLSTGVIGDRAMDKIASTVTGLAGETTHWVAAMPPAVKAKPLDRPPAGIDAMPVVAFTSCVNRIFGPAAEGEPVSVSERILSILHKANCDVIVPETPDDLCCGLAFSSQGFSEAGAMAQQRLGERLLRRAMAGASRFCAT